LVCRCRRIYVAEENGIVGTYYIRANQAGGGAHVANAGYAVGINSRGRGAGRALCLHSLETAKSLGFRAVQFNFVVETNTHAVALWKKCGFVAVGKVPAAFRPPQGRYADALIMHRELATQGASLA
jgi:ribosomal protein S18 acetylase RimI-like enzyme